MEKLCAACGSAPAGPTHTSYCRACWNRYQRERWNGRLAEPQERVCRTCGAMYAPKQRKASIYCSRSCKDKARCAALREETLANKPPARACIHCGMEFSPKVRKDAKFCSAECNSRAHMLKRKLRARGGSDEQPGYVRLEIAERDRWRCGICHRKVSKAKQYPDPMAGSMDHIVPVSQGGSSDRSNLRLTHLVCNLRRRDGGGGEQLALVG